MRYRNIDLIKFIAIYLVILYHFNTVNVNFMIDCQPIAYINYSLRTICSMCVPLFFFVNGFLLIKKDFDLSRHIRRILKLVLLAFLWAIIEVVLILTIRSESISLYDFFLEIWTRKTGMVGHLWYIGALVCVHMFFPLIKSAYDSNKKVFNYFMTLCAILVFGNSILNMISAAGYYAVIGWIDKSIADNVLGMYNPFIGNNSHAFGYFCVGCFIGGYQQQFDRYAQEHFGKLKSVIGIFISTILLSAWGMLYSGMTGTQWDSVWYGYDTIFTLVNVILVYVLSLNYKGDINKLYQYIRCVSCNTLGIFFIHGIIISLFLRLGIKEYQITNNFAVNMLLAFIILNISLIITLSLRKIPLIRLLLD